MDLTISSLKSHIEKLEREIATLREKNSRDPLTSCLRREALGELLESRKKFGLLAKNAYIIVIDIDHFKKINDTYGHLVGDEVLSQLGKFLTEHAHAQTLVSRFGGEEFVVVREGSREDALNWAESLRKKVESLKIKLNVLESVTFTISLGVAEWDTDGSFAGAFARADEALYQAKKEGRNRVAA